MMLLKDKVAVVYGAGGAIGGAVAGAFARAGARVFLSGRNPASVNVVAERIVAAGGWADVALVDALDGQAVEQYVAGVVEQTGRIDVSFTPWALTWSRARRLSIFRWRISAIRSPPGLRRNFSPPERRRGTW